MLYDKRWDQKTKTDSDYINAAADYIEEHGWCQRTYHDPLGQVCVMGALHRVTPEPEIVGFGEVNDLVYRLEERVLSVLTHRDSVQGWNDSECKSKAEAVAVLRKAANESHI